MKTRKKTKNEKIEGKLMNDGGRSIEEKITETFIKRGHFFSFNFYPFSLFCII